MQLRSPIELPETAGEPGGLGWVGDTPASEVPFSEALAVTSALIPLGISHVRTHGDAWVGSAATEEKYPSEHFQCQWRQRVRSHKTASPDAGRGGNPICFTARSTSVWWTVLESWKITCAYRQTIFRCKTKLCHCEAQRRKVYTRFIWSSKQSFDLHPLDDW